MSSPFLSKTELFSYFNSLPYPVILLDEQGADCWRNCAAAALPPPLFLPLRHKAPPSSWLLSRCGAWQVLQQKTERCDPLTALPLRDALQHSHASQALLFFADVNGMKRLNRERGYAAGDAHLLEAVACMQRCLGEDVCLCRYGGDEFAACLDRAQSEAARPALAQQALFRWVLCPLDDTDWSHQVDVAHRRLHER